MVDDVFRNLVPPNVEQLQPYQPGKPVKQLERELGVREALKIASNENPLGPSPKAVEAGRREMAMAHLYPDGGAFDLRAALSGKLGVAPNEIVFGAGSNEIIGMLVRTFCRPAQDTIVVPRYSFVSYRLFALAHGVELIETAVTEQLSCDPDALIDALDPRTRLVFLANPNNPTGGYVDVAGFEAILQALPRQALLVVDEAYHEYAVALADDYPRSLAYRVERPLLVTLRTFSKLYGLAGLRIGYAIAHPRVADYLNRVRRPFNATCVGQAAALAALGDDEHVQRSLASNVVGLEALRSACTRAKIRVLPSVGNFVLIDVGRDAATAHHELQRCGVIVRPMASWGLPNYLRVSVAAQTEIARVAATLVDVLAA